MIVTDDDDDDDDDEKTGMQNSIICVGHLQCNWITSCFVILHVNAVGLSQQTHDVGLMIMHIMIMQKQRHGIVMITSCVC